MVKKTPPTIQEKLEQAKAVEVALKAEMREYILNSKKEAKERVETHKKDTAQLERSIRELNNTEKVQAAKGSKRIIPAEDIAKQLKVTQAALDKKNAAFKQLHEAKIAHYTKEFVAKFEKPSNSVKALIGQLQQKSKELVTQQNLKPKAQQPKMSGLAYLSQQLGLNKKTGSDNKAQMTPDADSKERVAKVKVAKEAKELKVKPVKSEPDKKPKTRKPGH